jgi:hypothetical protein
VWRSVLSGLDSQTFFVCRRDERSYLGGSFVWLLTPWAVAFFKLPRNRDTNTMLLSSLSLDGMGSSMANQGSTTEVVFEAYIEHFAAPKFHEGEPLCASAAWYTTEHSGGLVLLTTPQRNLNTRFANSSQKDPADTLAR